MASPVEAGGAEFAGIDPTTGARLDPVYHGAGAEEVDLAANLAQEAFAVYSKLPAKRRLASCAISLTDSKRSKGK